MIVAIGVLSNGNIYADTHTASYSNVADNQVSWWGTSKAETYDVAVKLDASQFPGLDISAVRFRVGNNPSVSNYKVWVSSSLQLDENKENVADIVSADVVPSEGYVSLTLENPCAITAEGLYVGYSFTVDDVLDDGAKHPVAIANSIDCAGHGFWLHSSRTYKKWVDYNASVGSWIPFEITLSNLQGESVAISLDEEIYAAAGKEVCFDAVVTNHGYSSASSLTISYKVGEVKGECEVECKGLPEGIYNASCPVSISLPAFSNTFADDLVLSVEKVNEKPNTDADKETRTMLYVLSRIPQRTPLFEEYTGAGCGNCPRGIIGIDKMRQIYGDNFVAVAYHCDDVMSIYGDAHDFPNYAPAQPTSWIDRIHETDPYFGDDLNGVFGLDTVWNKMAQRFTPADMTLSCRWSSDDMEMLEAETSVCFAKPFSESDFRLVYILVADALKGSGRDWSQANYYSGETGKWPADFDYFVNASRYIADMEYNHVAIFATPNEGIQNVIPSSIAADQQFRHTQTISLGDAVNVDGLSLVQDKSRLGVVAAILDASTGEIINCAYASPENSAVSEIGSDPTGESASYYNLQGIKVSNPSVSGIYIRNGKKLMLNF